MRRNANLIVCASLVFGCNIKAPPVISALPPGVSAQKVISAKSGGVIEVKDDPELEGTKVIIPAGALDKDTLITIGKVNNPPANDDNNAIDAGPAVVFGPEGLKFNLPVEIRLPYSQEDLNKESLTAKNAFPHYFNVSSDIWERMDPVKPDPETVGAKVLHFSTYRIYGLIMITADNAVNYVQVKPRHRYLLPGQSQTFTADAFTAGGARLEGATVTWRAGNEAVATVDAMGNAVAVTYGTAAAYAKVESVEGTAVIEVVDRIPVGSALVIDSIGAYSSAGVGYYCDWIWDPETETESKACTGKLVIYASALAGGSEITVNGAYLFGQDGPNAAGTGMTISVSTTSGLTLASIVSYYDWSDIDAPGSIQEATFILPGNAATGTLRINSPGGSFSLPFVVWTKPVVRWTSPELLTPCDLSENPTMMVEGANFSDDIAISVGGAAAIVTSIYDSYAYIQLASGTQSGAVLAGNSAGTSAESAAELGFDSPVFTRYEGAWLYGFTPRVITNESSITFHGCGFTGAALMVTDSVRWTYVSTEFEYREIPPQAGAFALSSSTDTEAVSAGVPASLAFLAVTTPASLWNTPYSGLAHADALEWELPEYSYLVAHSDLSGDVFTFYSDGTGSATLSRLTQGSVATSVVLTALSGHYDYYGPRLLPLQSNAFILVHEGWADTYNLDIDRIDVNWGAGTATMTHLYTLLDADLIQISATADYIFLALRSATCCMYGFDLVRAAMAGGESADLLASSTDALVDMEAAGQTLLLSVQRFDEATFDSSNRLLALAETAVTLNDAELVSEIASSGSLYAGSYSFYQNKRNGKLYVHHQMAYEDWNSPTYAVSTTEFAEVLDLSGTPTLNPIGEINSESMSWWYGYSDSQPIYMDDAQVLSAYGEFDTIPGPGYSYNGWVVIKKTPYGGSGVSVWVSPGDSMVFPYGTADFLFTYSAYDIVTEWSASGTPLSSKSVYQLYRRN